MNDHNDNLSAEYLTLRFFPSSEGLQGQVIAPGEKLDARDIYAESVVVGTQINIKHQYVSHDTPFPPACQKPLFMVADLPTNFVARPREFDALKQRILQGNAESITAITSTLIGAGGYGKTTLALALCHDNDIRTRFRDGILWVRLGEQPLNLIGKIEDLLYLLIRERPGFTSAEAATTALKDELAHGQYLLVIDDIWRTSDLAPFIQGAPGCARLITTRLDSVLPSATRRVPIDAMSQEEGNQLLQKGLESTVERANAQRDFQLLASLLGDWPLLLTLANGVLRERVTRLGEPLTATLNYLQRAYETRGVLAFDAKNPSSRNEAVAQTIEVSLLQLDAAERKRYEKLAIFPNNVNVPLDTVSQFWRTTENLDELDAEDFCQRLYSLSLLLSYDLKNRQIRLHNVMRNYLQLKVADHLPALHQQFLDSYTLTHWANLSPEEPYLWEHLAEHLLAAHRNEALHTTLTDASFLEAQIRRAGVAGVLADLALLPDDEIVRDISSVVRSGATVLGEAPEEVWNQMQGRKGKGTALHTSLQPRMPRFELRFASLLPIDESIVSIFVGHTSGVNECVFSPNGRQVLSASEDGTLRLWDVGSGETARIFSYGASGLNGCAFSPDGQQVLSASDNGVLDLWEVDSGALIHGFGYTHRLWGCAFSPDGRQVLCSASTEYDPYEESDLGDRKLRLWEVASAKLVRLFEAQKGSMLECTFSPDGQQILGASNDGSLQLWDVASGESLREFRGHTGYVNDCMFSQDGQYILSASEDGTLRLWNTSSGKTIRIFTGHDHPIRGCALSPDGQFALSASADRTVRLWDVTNGKTIRIFTGHTAMVKDCAFSPDGRHILSASGDGTLRLWNVASELPLRIVDGHTDSVNDCAFSPDGKRALSASDDKTLRLWNVTSGKTLRVFTGHTDVVRGCVFSPDGKRALSASNDETLRLWDVASGKTLRIYEGSIPYVGSCTISPDGHLVLLSSLHPYIEKIVLGNLVSGESVRFLSGHTNVVRGCAFSPDGKQALSASDDRTLRLWNVASGKTLRVFEGHSSWVLQCTFSPDGHRALSVSRDRTLRLWDVASAQELTRWTTDASIFCCAFHPNGHTVIAGDGAQGIHFLSLVD